MAVVTRADELNVFLWSLAMRQDEIVGRKNPAIAKTITEATRALENEMAQASKVQNLAIERKIPDEDPDHPRNVLIIGENKLST